MEVNVHARIFCDCAKFFPRIFRSKSRLHIVIENRLIRYIHGNSLANLTIFIVRWSECLICHTYQLANMYAVVVLFQSNKYLFTILSVLQLNHTIQLQISISIAITYKYIVPIIW